VQVQLNPLVGAEDEFDTVALNRPKSALGGVDPAALDGDSEACGFASQSFRD
jgi:hypothetical protein